MQLIYLLISMVAMLIISATMLVRANDLGWHRGLKWKTRLVGFVLAGASPVGIIMNEWLSGAWPTGYDALFRTGLALVFVTTPYLPPWWRWISGIDDPPMFPYQPDAVRTPTALQCFIERVRRFRKAGGDE